MNGPCLPLRACLLSGGESRRMGRDKALLPHSEGDTWLERTLKLLAELNRPISLLSRHQEHLALAAALEGEFRRRGVGIDLINEPPPWEGPLLALHRLMQQHPGERLLLCPVDMPELTLKALQTLVAAATEAPWSIHLAHDGQRLQPLLGVYPASTALRQDLAAVLARGERRLQGWVGGQKCQLVALNPRVVCNVNRAEEICPAGRGLSPVAEPAPPAGAGHRAPPAAPPGNAPAPGVLPPPAG